jgi:hypothetical protein
MSNATKGQQNRESIKEKMESELKEYCPNTIPRMANLIAYDFNLAPDTVRYSYLFMFISKGILYKTSNGLYDVNTELTKKDSEKSEDSESFMGYVKKKQQKKKEDKPSA